MIRNDGHVTAERPSPDLAAARRNVQKLTATLAQTRGQELFAGDPAGLTARLREAQDVVRDCEARQRGRAHLSVVPDTFRPRPAVAELLGRWQTAHAIATDPSRPQGPGRLKAQAQAGLQEVVERADRLASACAMVPPGHRVLFADAMQVAERQVSYQRQQLAELASPAHPAAVALRVWEVQHPNADQELAEAWEILDYEVTEWAVGPGLGFLPPLPPIISAADRATWCTAAATQLAYRETYGVTDSSTPLGAEPWAADQAVAWEEARSTLARVGVHVSSTEEAAAQVATPGKRRSLSAVLAGVGNPLAVGGVSW
jgi:hypothetical protein